MAILCLPSVVCRFVYPSPQPLIVCPHNKTSMPYTMHDLHILTSDLRTSSHQRQEAPNPQNRPQRLFLYRSLIIWSLATFSLLLIFLLFVRYGWPGTPDPCTTSKPYNTCWCEAYEPSDIGTPGVRQAVNTWSNLYALFTSFIVAAVVCMDRQNTRKTRCESKNLMRGSDTYVADLYVFVVLFLGLGSMWFHASLTTWGGILDALSIYAFMAFLVMFSLRRSYIPNSLSIFWLGYWCAVAALTIVHALAQPRFEETSMLLVIISLFVYSLLEARIWRAGNRSRSCSFWWCAVMCGVVAAVFWGLSQTEKLLCNPTSLFQPHGIIWHPLAGMAAVLLFFYWRAAETVILELESDS